MKGEKLKSILEGIWVFCLFVFGRSGGADRCSKIGTID